MTINEALCLITGIATLLSICLAVTLNINWLWLSTFVDANLVQSAFTKWCPIMTVLKLAELEN